MENIDLETEIVNGKRIPMRWYTVKLSTKHLATIMMFLAFWKHGQPLPSIDRKDLFIIAEISEAIKDARIRSTEYEDC